MTTPDGQRQPWFDQLTVASAKSAQALTERELARLVPFCCGCGLYRAVHGHHRADCTQPRKDND